MKINTVSRKHIINLSIMLLSGGHSYGANYDAIKHEININNIVQAGILGIPSSSLAALLVPLESGQLPPGAPLAGGQVWKLASTNNAFGNLDAYLTMVDKKLFVPNLIQNETITYNVTFSLTKIQPPSYEFTIVELTTSSFNVNDNTKIVFNQGAVGPIGPQGAAGPKGENGFTSLIKTSNIGSDPKNPCTLPATKIESGIDSNKNRVLDIGEIDSVQFVCNGANGLDGSDGLNNLMNTSIIDATHVGCVGVGGLQIDTGIDANRNNTLDATEVKSTHYICNGSNGVNGKDGVNGVNGKDGINGVNGKDGISSLINTTTIDATDRNCLGTGGLKIDTGLDSDLNGVLSGIEISATKYVCNGVKGIDGANGANGLSGVNSLIDLKSTSCASFPGVQFNSGLDRNNNNTLDLSEITSTKTICGTTLPATTLP